MGNPEGWVIVPLLKIWVECLIFPLMALYQHYMLLTLGFSLQKHNASQPVSGSSVHGDLLMSLRGKEFQARINFK